jgi:uncharacterized protein
MTLIKQVENKIYKQFFGETTGHDWYHIKRVWSMANYIQKREGGNLEVIELSALLHDISDHKFNGGHLDKGGEVAYDLLMELGSEELVANEVRCIVNNVSYKGANTMAKMNSIEGRIVQDADRLDAIGAIGIARTFAYGGANNQPIHEPSLNVTMHDSFEEYAASKTSTINHFYEKLLLLKNRLNTTTAKEIGEKRHAIMEHFLEQFHGEWKFNANDS